VPERSRRSTPDDSGILQARIRTLEGEIADLI
jgi:hypothetical protein